MFFEKIFLAATTLLFYLCTAGQNICPVNIRLQIPPDINSTYKIEIIDFYTNEVLITEPKAKNFQQYLFKLEEKEPRWCMVLLKNEKDSLLARIGDFLVSADLVQIEINSQTFRNPITGGENDFINKHHSLLFELPLLFANYPTFSETKLKQEYHYPSATDGGLYVYYNEYAQNVLEIVKQYKDYYFVLFMVVKKAAYFSIPLLEQCALIFSPKLMQTKLGKELSQKIENYKRLMLGQKIPNSEILSLNGKASDLYSNYKNKKYTLIEFWASWCGPCRKYIKELQDGYAKLDTSKFDVLLISIDEQKSDWLEASKADNIIFKNYIDMYHEKKAIQKKYNLDYIPQNYLVDSNGVILASDLTEEQLWEYLKKEKLLLE